MARCILESLAMSYNEAMNRIRPLVGRCAEVVHIIGGGSLNGLLCQLTANVTAMPVLAGPHQATILGNLLTTAAATGGISKGEDINHVLRKSVHLLEYTPEDVDFWMERYHAYESLRSHMGTT